MNENFEDIEADAKSGAFKRHLRPGTQDESSRCPTQHERWFECGCVEASLVHRFRKQYGFTLIFAPAKILITWVNEIVKHVDYHVAKLFFYVAHGGTWATIKKKQKAAAAADKTTKMNWFQGLDSLSPHYRKLLLAECDNEGWVKRRNRTIVLSTAETFCNYNEKVRGKDGRQRNGLGRRKVYDVAFAIRDELHITGGLSTKTAVLFKRVLGSKAWRVGVTGTPIDTNLKKMRSITEAIADSDAWNSTPADHPNLSSPEDLSWWEELRKWIPKCHPQKIAALDQRYQTYTRSKTDNKKDREALRLDLARFVQQICIGRSDEAVWFDNSPVARLEPHFNFTIVVSMAEEMITLIGQEMDYYVGKSVARAKVALANWNAEGRRGPMPTVRGSFLPAVRIPRMNLLSTGFSIINRWLEKNGHERLNWTKAEYEKKGYLAYRKDFSFENRCPIDKYLNVFVKNSPRLAIIKHLVMEECAKDKILIFTNEVVEAVLITKVRSARRSMFGMVLTAFL